MEIFVLSKEEVKAIVDLSGKSESSKRNELIEEIIPCSFEQGKIVKAVRDFGFKNWWVIRREFVCIRFLVKIVTGIEEVNQSSFTVDDSITEVF